MANVVLKNRLGQDVTYEDVAKVALKGTDDSDVKFLLPSGKKSLTDMTETDVSGYATAQVVDANLVAGNIKKDTTILGVTGSYEGEGGGTVTLSYDNNRFAAPIELIYVNSSGVLTKLTTYDSDTGSVTALQGSVFVVGNSTTGADSDFTKISVLESWLSDDGRQVFAGIANESGRAFY